jgi:hypothetical protein
MNTLEKFELYINSVLQILSEFKEHPHYERITKTCLENLEFRTFCSEYQCSSERLKRDLRFTAEAYSLLVDILE